MSRRSPPPGFRRFRFADFELDEQEGVLRGEAGPIHLAPQLWRALELLVSRAAELVSREELRRAIWGDSTLVEFEVGLNHCIYRLRTILGDDPEAPRFILTVPRRGYRFVAPVESRSDHRVPVLAVLPFANLDRSRASEPLADGLTDAVLTELARNDGLQLLPRRSVLHLKGSEQTPAELGAELGAEALLDGTLFEAGRRLRVTVQLVGVDPVELLWSESFDGVSGEIFELERRVARRTAEAVEKALGPSAVEAQLAREPAFVGDR